MLSMYCFAMKWMSCHELTAQSAQRHTNMRTEALVATGHPRRPLDIATLQALNDTNIESVVQTINRHINITHQSRCAAAQLETSAIASRVRSTVRKRCPVKVAAEIQWHIISVVSVAHLIAQNSNPSNACTSYMCVLKLVPIIMTYHSTFTLSPWQTRARNVAVHQKWLVRDG